MTHLPDSQSTRLPIVDEVRGLAIIGVVIFHLIWDLDFTGMIAPGLSSNPLWIAFGRLLAGTFMFLVGVSLVLANQKVVDWGKATKRIAVIVCAALIITAGTYLAFPTAFVFYGILHAIAVASIIGLLLVHFPPLILLLLGILIWSIPLIFSDPAFDTRWLAWIGFSQQPPYSNDLVPIFPWLGITLVGMALSRLALNFRLNDRLSTSLQRGKGQRFLSFCGRYSLPIYLVHQPILLGLLIPLSKLVN